MTEARWRHTRDLVAAHRVLDLEEREHQRAILALIDSGAGGAGSDVFSRQHFDPGHLTASAFVIDASRTSLLLVWHLKLERWLQPGGHIEPEDPDVLLAAAREVEEETGLQGCTPLGPGLFDVDVHAIPARGGARAEPAHAHHDLRVALVAPAGAEAIVGDGVGAVRWVPLDAFDRLAHDGSLPTDRSVMRAVERLQRRLGPITTEKA